MICAVGQPSEATPGYWERRMTGIRSMCSRSRHLVIADDLAAERPEGKAGELQMRPGEREADDGDGEADGGDQMAERQPPAGEQPDEIAQEPSGPVLIVPAGRRGRARLRPKGAACIALCSALRRRRDADDRYGHDQRR